jgi:sulfur relay (sulfurtransferase) complex TusBCD TusD component (DsrE family)
MKTISPAIGEFLLEQKAQQLKQTMPVTMIVPCSDARGAQLLALFEALDERGKLTTLALLATAVKLHPRVPE